MSPLRAVRRLYRFASCIAIFYRYRRWAENCSVEGRPSSIGYADYLLTADRRRA